MRTAAAATPQELRELIQRIMARDTAALGELYDLTSPILYGLLLRMLRRPEWAEEALQDCYLRVWQRAETYTPDKGEPIAWLIGIARYRGLDRLQTAPGGGAPEPQTVTDDAMDEMVSLEPSPEDKAVEREGLERLDRCLRGLQEEQRRSVLMAYYEGYSHSELALVMDAPLGTVKAWVRRGLARLRECLERP